MFMSFPIAYEHVMNTIFSIVMPLPYIVHLYVNVSALELDINLNANLYLT